MSVVRSAVGLEIAAAIIAGLSAVGLSRRFDIFDRLDPTPRGAGHHSLEAALTGLVIATILLLVVSVRRWFMFRREARERAASEQRLTALFAASPFPVGLFALADGRIIEANTMAVRAAGVPREALIGCAIGDLPYWDQTSAEELLRQLRAQGTVRNLEMLTRRAAVVRTVLVSAQVVELDGEPCFLAAMSDITHQREAERAREASAAELSGVFQAMRDVVLVLGRDGQYLKVPATNSDLLYRPLADLVGRNVRDVLPPDEAAGIITIIAESLDGRRAVTTEYRLEIDGREIWFSATVTPRDDASVVWVARDITDERRAREQLAASEAQYRLLFGRNPQPMWVLSDDRFLDVNEAALRHYGYTRDEFLALSPDAIRPADEIEHFHLARHIHWPLSESRLFHHRTRAGDVIDVEITRDDILYDGMPARLVLAKDVTAQLRAARELAASLSLQQATLDATADGIMALDDAGTITSWNRKFVELIGVPAQTMDRAAIEAAFAETMHAVSERRDGGRSGTPTASSDDMMVTLELADGRIIERYDRPQRINGEVVGRVCSFRDVTERDRAVARGQVLAQRFQSAFGDAPIGMTIMMAGGRWLQVNRAMCELLGRDEEELIGKTSDAITHEDDTQPTHEVLARLRAGERTVRIEKRYRHANGRDVWTLVSATMLGTGAGASDLIISHVLDITEQRAAESELRRQALVFGTIADAVVICAPDGRVVDSNDAATTILGYSREELLGQTARLWQRQDVIPPIFEKISSALARDGAWSGEYAFAAKDGRTGVVESTVRILRDASGNHMNSIGVFRDVTERKEMTRQLVQAQKLEAIGSLAAGIAHEINTPTQYVGDNVRFLGDGVLALGEVVGEARILADAARAYPELAACVSRFDASAFEADMEYLLAELPAAALQSREGCERISDIVKAMKGFSHPSSVHKQLVDLNAAVQDTATVCRSEWKYVAELVTDFDPDLPFVSCFPGELQQVVLNLIVNAAHAISDAHGQSGELGHITIATRHDDEWVEVSVSDDGCGIPDAIRAKIFDPFFTTKKVGAGTGQGLSISHATVVRKHAGTLTFESEVGKGTTFVIRLPLDLALTESAAA